ncbi:hypothetical protein [Flavobacterium quisquiliarum]|uniref:Por secretion system C-terminal sorting domain-containing protein n=1 Tax=Flavobacterium quisquiliarum TaxID=1834436 RepID=A0ABV8WCH1_9FLAO|nr:hypothetical protein [Flavobacterium quisquiliarum]MBW1657785.1 hypothetical protein [Flavobacterium quisquiliarum]
MLFCTKIAFAQNTVTYTSLTNTLNINSGVEGTVDVLVNCYGSSSNPIFLDALQSCGNNDGVISSSYTNGSILTPGQNTTIRYKFKKTVATDTQIVYKFSTNGSCFQDESKMIKITVNYKGTSTTNPTNPPGNIGNSIRPMYGGSIETYVGSEQAVSFIGSELSGYTNEWQIQDNVLNGEWITIPNETERYIHIQNRTKSFYVRRIVRASTGSYNISNVLFCYVYPRLENNTINLSGSVIEGSTPTGARNVYEYNWYAYILEGEEPLMIQETTKSLTIPANVYQFIEDAGAEKAFMYRRVKDESGNVSANQYSNSNVVTIFRSESLQNNTIAINGSTITGSLPSGGNGTYEYVWKYTSEEIGTFEFVGETGQNLVLPSWVYNANLPINVYQGVTVTRTVKSGNRISSSNILTIQPLPGIVNNTIAINGSTITGSLPSGGDGTYEYLWKYTSEEIGTFEFVGETGQNLVLPAWVYNPNYPINVYNGMTVIRVVKSRNGMVSSNTVTILPYPETVNNTIAINGSTITGSLPSGGDGTYEYVWKYTSEEIGTFEFVGETGQNLVLPAWVYNSNLPINVYNGMTVNRVVKSRNRPSSSNVLTIPSMKSNRIASKEINKESFASDLTVYPNPTSESINFATNFTTDKNIEIILYSEKLGNEKSVYKGKVAPNQVINWSIPTNYQKGIYFYKILSENKEVKSGKLIFN